VFPTTVAIVAETEPVVVVFREIVVVAAQLARIIGAMQAAATRASLVPCIQGLVGAMSRSRDALSDTPFAAEELSMVVDEDVIRRRSLA
jgi:hypothetical protein